MSQPEAVRLQSHHRSVPNLVKEQQRGYTTYPENVTLSAKLGTASTLLFGAYDKLIPDGRKSQGITAELGHTTGQRKDDLQATSSEAGPLYFHPGLVHALSEQQVPSTAAISCVVVVWWQRRSASTTSTRSRPRVPAPRTPPQLMFIVGHELAHSVLFHHGEKSFWSTFLFDTVDDVLCVGHECLVGPITARL